MTTHGQYGTPEYWAWRRIKNKCLNPRNDHWPDYGGRGITVCKRWAESFAAFLEDIGPRPAAHLTIERLNNDLGYGPSNCIWADRKVQARNRRSSRIIEVNGEKMSLAEASEQYRINYDVLKYRITAGWHPDLAVSMPSRLEKYRLKEFERNETRIAAENAK